MQLTLKNINVSTINKAEVEIDETSFATGEDLQKVINRIEILEQNKIDFVNSIVGREKYFNTDNNYKDQDIIKLGVKTYGLAGTIVSINDYP
ncbi:MAG: hypothetical protein LBH40_02130 [Alphaproteobacteria bacterium]|jgi:hypothetical protein|nr:hypothetical protein [Alphaproteobacteria bacterium]